LCNIVASIYRGSARRLLIALAQITTEKQGRRLLMRGAARRLAMPPRLHQTECHNGEYDNYYPGHLPS